MSALKVFANLMSQPSRAVVLFLKANNIPHELKTVDLKKGEHKLPEYLNTVNRFGRVPAIIDGNINIVESIAILRYLARKHKVPDHWYPGNLKAQSKVDEFLEWHHIGLRAPLSVYTEIKFFFPVATGKPPTNKELTLWHSKMETALDEVENIWLKSSPYLAGEQISIADLIGLCEVDQAPVAGYDPSLHRPKLQAWQERVREDLKPHYEEVVVFLNKVIQKYKGDPFALSQKKA